MSTLKLKWGTVKAWSNLSDDIIPLMGKYLEDSSASCALDNPSEERKNILLEIIDKFDGEIWNDWNNKKLTKEEAKNYIINYGSK